MAFIQYNFELIEKNLVKNAISLGIFNPLAPNGPYLDHELWLHKILSKIKKKKNLIIDSKYSENFLYKNKKKLQKKEYLT